MLVEPAKRFTTCFHSNLYLGGFKTWEEITHSYDKIAKAYGIKHVRQMAAAIDREKKTGAASPTARSLPYDRLVLAPGIDLKFDSRARLVGGGEQEAAARLAGRRADATAQAPAQRAVGRRHHRDDRAAQSLPLPARPL